MARPRLNLAAITVLLLLVGLSTAPPAAAEEFLSGYVSNEDSSSLTKFDTATNQVDESFQSDNPEPGSIAITANGEKAFVGESCNLIEPNEGWLYRIATGDGNTAKLKIAQEGCVSKIAISPKADLGERGETVWAVVGDEVVPVDSVSEMTSAPVAPPPPCPNECPGQEVLQSVDDVAMSPDGNTLYVLYTNETLEQGTEEEIETYLDELVAFDVGGETAVQLGEPVAVAASQGKSIAISPDGSKAFVTSSECSLKQVCVNGLAVYNLDPAPLFYESQIFDLTEAGQILITPDERLALVAQTPGTIFKGESVKAFELDTGPPYEDFTFLSVYHDDPIAMAFAPNGQSLYVGFHDRAWIGAYPLHEDEVGEEVEIPAGEGPVGGIAVTPAQAPEARLVVHAAKEGEPSQFDASGSTIQCDEAQCSEIAEYKWAFGDGAEETTTVPTTEHTYQSAGPFTASVTEVSSYGVSTERTYDGHQTLIAGGPGARATVTVTPPTLATQASATTRLGGMISDTAILSGGEGDGGSIEFQLFGPGAPSCEGTPLETWTVAVNGDGEYQSGQYSASELGTYHWTAAYTDGAADPPSLGRCGDAEESVEVGKYLPTISATASPSVVVGGLLDDEATVTGEADPTGTVTFSLYPPGNLNCNGTPVYTETGELGARPGSPQVAESGTYASTQVGKYRWVAAYSGDARDEAVTTGCNAPGQAVSVARATTTITTSAAGTAHLPGLITDAATVTGYHPSGTVAFTLYGPLAPNCEGPPLFTTSGEVGNDGTATAPAYTPTMSGEYHWIASYSGDPNNESAVGNCGDPNESLSVGKYLASLKTSALEAVAIGGAISDAATLSGAHDPSGTIDFALYGPHDQGCNLAPLATASVPVTENGAYAAEPFTPTAPGTYRWVASYSGDAENEAEPGSCGEAGETSVVEKATPALSTDATGEVGLGGQVAATASVAGGDGPTGTVTFEAYGPGDGDCTGSPAFTATVPLAADGTAASGAFTPLAAGSYSWRATYSGDADNAGLTGGCGPSSTITAPTASSPSGTQPASPPPTSSPRAELKVKLSGPHRGSEGRRLTYRFEVANVGEAASARAELAIGLGGVRVEIGTAKGSGCDHDRPVTCKVGPLAAGAKAVVKVTLLPRASGRLKLTGALGGDDVDAAGDRAVGTTRIAAAARRR